MRRSVVAVAVLLLAAGCGGAMVQPADPAGAALHSEEPTFPSAVRLSPEAVVLEWSDALNHGLNDDAANFFASQAYVVAEDGRVLVLHGRAQASSFNASIACQGRIIGMSRKQDRVWAAFILDQRGTFACPAPGVIDTARFTIAAGRIVMFEDLPD